MDNRRPADRWRSRCSMSRMAACVLFLISWISDVKAVTHRPEATWHDQQQRHDNTGYIHEYQAEVIFKNQVLPEDVEVTLIVNSGSLRRLVFMIEEPNTPISLTLTPCAMEMEWSLLLLRSIQRNYNDQDEPWYNQVPNTEDSNLPELQTSYIGKDRRTYYNSRTPAGLYILELESRIEDTSVRVLMTKYSTSTYYPELPEEHKVRVLKVRKDSLTFSWRSTPSSSDTKFSYEYCVSANTHEHFKTLCSLVGEQNEDFQPSKIHSRINHYSWEKIFKESKGHNSRSSSSMMDTRFECVGRQTWHNFRSLEEGRQYFLDVFVVNTRTNASSSYRGAIATTMDRGEESSKLNFNDLTPVQLRNVNGFTSTLRFTIPTKQRFYWLFVQSCAGPGPVIVKITRGSVLILDEQVMESKTFTLKDLSLGSYRVTITSPVHKDRTVRVLFSGKYHRYPFPSLPDDKRIKVFDSQTTCSSVTLAWEPTANEKVRYCLYKTLTDPDADDNDPFPHNSCDDRTYTTGQKDKIVCKRFHRFSRHRVNNVIMQKVRGLKPSKTYVFQVLVTKLKGKSLAYDSVWVTTSHNCSLDKR